MLLKQGLTQKEIMDTRQLSVNTIENHIMKIIELTDELDPTQYITADRMKIVHAYLKEHADQLQLLKPLKDGMMDILPDLTYFELKIALAIFQKQNK